MSDDGASVVVEEQEVAGGTPEVVSVGVVSGPGNETFPAVDPVTGDLWFSRYDEDFDSQTIFVARSNGSSFDAPGTAPFSGMWGDRAPRFTPDGSGLYFTSNRPLPGGTEAADMNIWLVTRGESGWSDPRPAGGLVNTSAPEIHAAATDEALWFAAVRPGGRGRSDIYRASFPLESSEVTHVPADLNDERSQPDLLVAPDESWMILVVTDHPDGLGGDDLFLVRRTSDGWGSVEHLPAPINSAEYEYGPTLDRSTGTLYFTSHRSGHADVYRIPLDSILGR